MATLHNGPVVPYREHAPANTVDLEVRNGGHEEFVFVYGDTPASRLTGITDRQAAGWDPMPENPDDDGYDVNERHAENIRRWVANHRECDR